MVTTKKSKKKNSLKNRLIQLVETKNILEYDCFDTNISEERYFVSVANVLKTINHTLVDQFMFDFQKIIYHSKLPVFKVTQVVDIYKVWLKNKDFCNNLTYLATKSGKKIIANYNTDNWDIIFNYSIYHNSNELYAIFNIMSVFFKIINTGQSISNRILEAFMLFKFSKRLPKSIRSIEKYIQKNFFLLPVIINSNKHLWNEEEYVFLLSNRLRLCIHIPDIPKEQQKLFSQFLDKILNQNINYIFTHSLMKLFEIFKIYIIKPEIFENLKIENKIALKPIPTAMKIYFDIDIVSLSILTKHLSQETFKFPQAFSFKYFQLSSQEKTWFFNILKGQSVRKQSLPLTLSRKGEAVFIHEKPKKQTTLIEEIAIAEYISKNVSPEFALVASTLLTSNKSKNDYYIKVFTTLFHKGLKTEHIQETYDYMNAKHFFEKNNESYKTKKIKNLLKEVNLFHEELLMRKTLSSKKIPTIKFALDAQKQKITINGNVFEFIPLQSAKQLFVEGFKMRHCVYNYTQNCINDGEIIYSLRKKEKGKSTLLLTIEVDKNKRIIQIRGKYNRNPTPDEIKIIKLWADKKGFILLHV